MSETWGITFWPEPESYETLTRRLFRVIADLGWLPDSMVWGAGGRREVQPSSVSAEILLEPGGGIVSFTRQPVSPGSMDAEIYPPEGEVWLSLGTYCLPGAIEIGSDPVFFTDYSGSETLLSMLRAIQIPEGTLAFGDTEYRHESPERLGLAREATRERLERFGLFWVDTLTPPQWDSLLRVSPDSVRGLVAKSADTYIARLWANPFDRCGDLEEWRAIARAVALVSL